MPLALAVVGVAKMFDVAFMGLAGTCHQQAAENLNVPFIAGEWYLFLRFFFNLNVSSEWFADLDYDEEGKLLITKYVIYFPCSSILVHLTLICYQDACACFF